MQVSVYDPTRGEEICMETNQGWFTFLTIVPVENSTGVLATSLNLRLRVDSKCPICNNLSPTNCLV